MAEPPISSSQTSSSMEQYLVHSIHSSLSLGLHENARFLAERLVAADPSEVGSGRAQHLCLQGHGMQQH